MAFLPFKSDPAIARDLNGKLEAVAVGNDSKFYVSVQSTPNSTTWTNWNLVEGSSAIPGTPIIVQNQDGTLVIFSRGGDGNIYANPQTSPTNLSWSGWGPLQTGMTFHPFKSDAAVASNANGTLEVVAVGNDGHLYSNVQTVPNSTSWAGWQLS